MGAYFQFYSKNLEYIATQGPDSWPRGSHLPGHFPARLGWHLPRRRGCAATGATACDSLGGQVRRTALGEGSWELKSLGQHPGLLSWRAGQTHTHRYTCTRVHACIVVLERVQLLRTTDCIPTTLLRLTYSMRS